MVYPNDSSQYTNLAGGGVPEEEVHQKTMMPPPTPPGSPKPQKRKKTRFWMEDPKVLFKRFCILPQRDNSLNENLNCLTILVVVTALVLLLLKFPSNYVLIGSLVLIVLIATIAKCVDSGEEDEKEGFARDPHYVSGDDFIQTNVTPLVAEEWQFNPPAYELVSQVASDGRDPRERVFGKEQYMEPPFAPYRQYLTRTNLMPNDESEISLFSGGVTGARTFANDAFTRHSVAFREDQMRLFKKINSRRWRNLGFDTISPFTSF